MTISRITALAVAAGASLALAPAAGAVDYPPPSKPKSLPAPKGPFKTHTVCRKGCRFKTIQAAVNRAKAGDTVKVRPGTYRERVVIKGARKRYLKIIGDPKKPERVKLSGIRSKPRTVPNNGITINGADNVTLNGLSTFDYDGNGFFAVNVNGYRMTNLVAKRVGVYGLYAFNAIGGSMTNSVAAWNNDSGFYVGQTPPQTKPKRTILRGLTAYGNQLGYSGTNSRYVTITKSRWFNNGIGIVPNALDSEKFVPFEDNVISDNDIFFNNFNYYRGTPWKIAGTSTGTNFPVGMGILLFGGRRTQVTNNRVYGNYVVGIAGLQQGLLKRFEDQELIGNRVWNNQFGNGGKNLNGRDLAYDGDGSDNCFDPAGTQNNVPKDNSTLVACGPNGYSGPNKYKGVGVNPDGTPSLDGLLSGNPVFAQMAGWSLLIDRAKPESAEAAWVKNPQAPVPGVTPLETWTPAFGAR